MKTSPAKNNAAACIFLVGWLLSACSTGISQPPDRQPFLPPTLAVTSQAPTSVPSPASTHSAPTTIPVCLNNLTYLDDLTIPDGSVVNPGSSLDKRWKVENSGSCSWDAGYELRLVSGSEMGATVTQDLYPARSHTQATLRIQFTAPGETGVYRSAWQAYDPQDQPFGDPVFIEIMVSP